MLEVRNLSKIYKAKNKGGVDTKALDDVSLSFAETGMVFLLGKSGSGKSTLLNICGGLDAPTSGEVIVKGKSSKDFSQTDFDSYRNTYVGFIFQEYNILSEFTVEDNIALALELQGKPKDKNAINDLLEQVDLTGFAKRKPNTLSGGQKQRIAIARALIKSPEIIMADEPTGALDSATGKQVFDTLKKLSKDKLVLVVSHDREFAEQYGDRIIELKDGKILSDVSKTARPNTSVSKNVSTVGDVLCIKRNAELGEQDFEEIKAFLKASRSDVIIANNENDVAKFKKASRINDEGAKEIFVDTDGDKIEKKNYKPEDSRFIRSRLPMRHAVKIGASSLKSKPFRLALTIILCAVSFVLFGLLSTLSFYNSESSFKQTLLDSDREYVAFDKQYLLTEKGYEYGEELYEFDRLENGVFSSDEITSLKSDFGNNVFGGVNTTVEYGVRSKTSNYWYTSIPVVAHIPQGNSLRDKVRGEYPENDGEICISSYSAEMLVACIPVNSEGSQSNVSSPDELIGKYVRVGNRDFKITGILDSGSIDPKFDSLKTDTEQNFALMSEFDAYLNDGLHLVAFVSEKELLNVAKNFSNAGFAYFGDERRAFAHIVSNKLIYINDDLHPNASYNKLTNEGVIYFGAPKTALSDGEAVISAKHFAEHVSAILQNRMQSMPPHDDKGNINPEYIKVNELFDKVNTLSSGVVFEYDENGSYKSERPLTEAEYNSILAELIEEFEDIEMTVGLAPSNNQNVTVGEMKNYNVVGIVSDYVVNDYTKETSVYISESEFNRLWDAQKVTLEHYTEVTTNYVAPKDGIYNILFAPFAKSQEQTEILWGIYSNELLDDNSSKISLSGYYVNNLRGIDTLVKDLSKIFLYVGLVLAVFAMLLFSNFIAISISQKKKEIGILRAVGARGTDVFKIFFSESFFIAMICALISTVGSIVVCGILNKTLASELGASLFVFGIPSFLVIVAIATLTAVIATFLPVWSAAKKKPVDSIRAI